MSRIARALNDPSFLSYSHLLIDDEYERVLPLSEFRATRRAFVPSQLSQLDAKNLGENLRNATRRKLALTRDSRFPIPFYVNCTSRQKSRSQRVIFSSRKQDPTRRIRRRRWKKSIPRTGSFLLLAVHRAPAKFEWISTKKRTTNPRPPDNASVYVFNVSPPTGNHATTGQICLSNISASRYK